MRVSVQLTADSRPSEIRSVELGPNLTLIRRIRGEGLQVTPGEPVKAGSVADFEGELNRIAQQSDISALKAERRGTETRWIVAHDRVADLQETQFQLLWNVAQLWIAAMVLFPLPLLFWSWDELFGHYVPHMLTGMSAAGSVYFLKNWWAGRPALREAEDIFLELDLSLIGIDDQLAAFAPLAVDEKSSASLVGESLEQFAVLLNRFSPARDIVVLASGETGRALSRLLVDRGAAETPEGDELAITRA